MDQKFSRASELLHTGDHVETLEVSTEAMPLYQTTAFTWKTLSEAEATYQQVESGKNYTYIRTCNPNRDALAEVVSYLEAGEKSLIFSSGMGAISSTLLTLAKPGDHIVYSNCCYGETLDIMQKLLVRFGVEVTPVDFNDAEKVAAAMKPNTSMVYTEVVANPCMGLADIPTLAEIAHKNGAKLIVDNTFTTSVAYQPLVHGADIVINSMTKFMNGHSDAICGAVTASAELIDQIRPVGMYLGTPGDPFSSWLVLRGIKTMEMRLNIQMANAAKLAAALEKDPHVEKVLHPSLESYQNHKLALQMFESNEKMCAMVSMILPEDVAKMDDFMSRLHLAHYAPTLGGIRTTFQNPCTSSHRHNPDAERRAAGITPGMIRISVGCENADDLIADFTQALKAFD
mgnify:CR=1 FL=1